MGGAWGERPTDRVGTDADPRPRSGPTGHFSSTQERGRDLKDNQPGHPSIRHAPPTTRSSTTDLGLRRDLQRGPGPSKGTRARRLTVARRTDPPTRRRSTRSTGTSRDADAPRRGAARHARLPKRASRRRPSASGAKAPPGECQQASAEILRTPLDDTADAHTPSLTGSGTSSQCTKPHPAGWTQRRPPQPQNRAASPALVRSLRTPLHLPPTGARPGVRATFRPCLRPTYV